MKRILKVCLSSVLFFLYRTIEPWCRFSEVSILAYHSISNAPLDTAVTSKMFRTHLSRLKADGYSFISLSDVVAYQGGASVPCKAVALTFDDGYADFESAALPILDEFDAPATIFVMGDEVGARSALGNALPLLNADALARVRAHPRIEIGYHSRTHANLGKLSGSVLEDEVRAPFVARYFAYPGGNYSAKAVDVVRVAGYDAAFSIKRDLVRRGKSRWLLPRIVVLKDDGEKDVVRYVSMVQHWYAMFRSLIKKYV
ncbi:MAG: polysaccharide deacetylase [Parcubacteria group bacterium Greene0714_7]|nr:MAG: polysaccharide deacetylase [Parcubacteria group bacterium Greene0714_7]